MSDKETKEQKWACGCHEVDGDLVAECTQTAPQGEISASQHAVNRPFARKCARLANLAKPAAEPKDEEPLSA